MIISININGMITKRIITIIKNQQYKNYKEIHAMKYINKKYQLNVVNNYR